MTAAGKCVIPIVLELTDPLPEHVWPNLQVLTHLKQIPSLLNHHPHCFDLEFLAETSSLSHANTSMPSIQASLGVHQIGEGPMGDGLASLSGLDS